MRTIWQTRLKRLLFALPLLLLLLPAVQAKLEMVRVQALGGYAERAPRPEFTWAELYATAYQPALEKYLEDRIGFREWLIRLRNQLAYSVFNVSRANKVLVGEDGVLLDEVAIRAYLGQDFKGHDAIKIDVRKLKAVQDSLAKRGVLLVFAMTPDKANFYPEKQPAYFHQLPRRPSNYTVYVQEMQKRGVNLIDLAAVFQRWKDTASYPLFPRGGIHWSGYGIPLAADTLFRYIEQRGHLDLPDFATTGHTRTSQPRDTDNDIARTLNLIWEPAAYPMSYPTVAFQPLKAGQQKPKLLVVGDSFVWSLIGFYPFVSNLFDASSQFWYYNTKVELGARPDMPEGREVWKLDRKAEILAHKVVLVMFTQHNLVTFDKGFSAGAYELFCSYSPAQLQQIKIIAQQLEKIPAVQDSLWKESSTKNLDYQRLLQTMAEEKYELMQP